MISALIIAVLFGLAQAQSVEFKNSYTLQTPGNLICSALFTHEEYHFSTCSNARTNGSSEFVHVLQVWNCATTPCLEDSVIETGLDNKTMVRLQARERLDAGNFRFVISDLSNIQIYQCNIAKNQGNNTINALSCGQIFEPIRVRSFETRNLLVSDMSSDSEGNVRLAGQDSNENLVLIDCLVANETCFIIDNIPAPEIYSNMNITSVFRVNTLRGGAVTIFSDIMYQTQRGCIVKLSCQPISATLGESSANCSYVSTSMADDAKPFSHLGYELISKAIQGSDNITILAGAPNWANNNGYLSGAVFSFFCSAQFGADAPCSLSEINRHEGPSSGCYDGACHYGDINSIAVSGDGKHVAFGSATAGGGVGIVEVFYCKELQMVTCARAGSFTPNQPPRSDYYGSVLAYNQAGTLLAATAGYFDLYQGGHYLWMVNTIFNTTVIP